MIDLSHPAVKKILKERFGNKLPLSEKIIPPAGMFESELLVNVHQLSIFKANIRNPLTL